ncbi:MAG: transcription termination factor NusA [Candidatus Portnoybacteria bacterium RIFCSPLOWO2_12_FULL_39_9]|uniref:Transcription termination/antitermination protein NusA n=1 Tax=Candidatus Portnoybacteria bacterium RIFCSPHIGHO2_12_FULL_38_9 TaxID=1801997 RepID=A0A1G2FEE8_9BACT|nr:MAG: transcription termination factor NusA [Candidatus Portnoybacteria bacterium RBG_13_40_8]OGZ35924.1 MAG: transcription termination factor NusA [Candidatus Portnoybacteria bacterium RIFCSPHIGHO2_02_FULL_39_12]OGZ36446.1 MAG: transcription termination factor NusA [Candidatus Portnoybacteria bacterium RIFCSPHIGHO2_12_FULL_38_9]OGZ38141.1 MAG: transcription termination factor NusA [Candidatus Portnoybacteria bacterium RIFCSPLOWO2_01_FULL_38_39]OGZ40259.1 MAG: transcription termination factor
MDKQPFLSAIEQICEEKGIAREKVIETIEMAIAAAYKRDYGRKGQNIKVKFYLETGKMEIFQVKLVVDQSMLKTEEETEEEKRREKEIEIEIEKEEEEKRFRFNPEKHIMIEEAKKIKDPALGKIKKVKPGDELEFPLEVHEEYGRIAAQTAKQVIIQRLREAEREAIYNEYKEKEGEIVSGLVQRIEGQNVFLDIGKATGILFPEEQVFNDRYRPGQRLKVYILEVQKDSRGPSIILSRAHPKMVSKLFALEVPEISGGSVQIKSIAREPGSRSKIAAASIEEGVDPIGSMVGQKGTRVLAVINELGGEKIDIIKWSSDPAEFIKSALSPAKVTEVEVEKKRGLARAIVPEDQLSLAIGIRGQNVRLAAKLTGWKIDVVSEKRVKGLEAEKTKETKFKKTKKTTAPAEKKPKKEKTKKDAKKKTKKS